MQDLQPIWIGDGFSEVNDPQQLFLLFDKDGEGHFHYLKSLASLLYTKFYCIYCKAGYKKKSQHCCPNACKMCRSKPICEEMPIEGTCPGCNKEFNNEECYQRHLDNQICDNLKTCPECKINYSKEKR